MVLKSRALREEEGQCTETVTLNIPAYQREDVVKIRPIETFNEYVIVIPFALNTNIILPNQMQYQPYGVVVGVSKGIMTNEGTRVPSALRPGDVVRFWERHIIDSDYKTPDPHYQERRLVLISERSVISRLPPVPFEIVSEQAPAAGLVRLAAPERQEHIQG